MTGVISRCPFDAAAAAAAAATAASGPAAANAPNLCGCLSAMCLGRSCTASPSPSSPCGQTVQPTVGLSTLCPSSKCLLSVASSLKAAEHSGQRNGASGDTELSGLRWWRSSLFITKKKKTPLV